MLRARQPKPDRSTAKQPASRSAGGAGLSGLQRTAGNRAVSGLLRRPSSVSTVQRDLENVTLQPGTDEEDRKAAHAFFDAYREAVDKAYKFVVSVPSLGPRGKTPGHLEQWCQKWGEFTSGGRPKLMAATFGYVIETLVTHDPEFKPKAPPGCTVLPQVVVGGTRPDLVLFRAGKHVAWLDLTASDSVDHIYTKEGWATKIGIFAEATYPSLGAATLALMVQNKDNQGTLTDEEFTARQLAASIEYAKRKQHWEQLGKRYAMAEHRTGLRSRYGLNLQINPGLKREYITGILQQDFEALIDEKMVPSILRAMGVNPAPWEFGTGYNESVRAGEAWLVDHDPTPPDQLSEIASRPREPERRGGSRKARAREQRPRARDLAHPYFRVVR